MVSPYNKIITLWWFFMLVAILDRKDQGRIEGVRTLDKNNFKPKPKGTIKTIEVFEDGDLIDCILFNKQPAFDNPLIKKMKINPSSYPRAFNETKYHQPKIIQTWNKYGECPEGTVPIRRTWNNTGTLHPKHRNGVEIHEYATVFQEFNHGQGGRGHFNVWNPQVIRPDELSLSQIWVVAGPQAELNAIEAGWEVYPGFYGNMKTRFFIYWTTDGYKTKCVNLECADFVQMGTRFVPGMALQHVSEVDGEPIDMLISISRSKDDGNWWLQVDDEIIGHWPGTLFTTLRDGADSIAFGGEIVNQQYHGRHTITTMGSGHFAEEGYKKACYIRNIQVVNDAYEWVEPHLTIQSLSRPECYSLISGPLLTNLGTHFYFGGPGYSEQCR